MRLNDMKCLRYPVVAAAMTLTFAALSAVAPTRVFAQRAAPAGTGETFKDTSMLKPPAGVRVAIIEFQDLLCPACAHAFPIVHAAAAHYNIPLMERDFPLPNHAILGSLDGAIWARFLQDKVSMKTADEYRGAVFAAQAGIQNKDDMMNFTRRFFQTHQLQMPFVPDPTGQFAKEVQADKDLGEKLGVYYTPSIVVCSQHEWVHVTDISLLYQTIDEVAAKAGAATAVKAAVARKKTVK